MTHAIGLLLSIIGLILLLINTVSQGSILLNVSVSVYGLSLILLYAASTSYHYVQKPEIRRKLNVLDHAAIYVLIAGTYTPFTLVGLQGWVGLTMFAVVWCIAITGIVLKLYFTGRFEKLSTISYVALGWVAIFGIKPLLENLQNQALIWLLIGGIFYSLGAVLFSLPKLKYNHAIFHVFVLFGSGAHFVAVFCYL